MLAALERRGGIRSAYASRFAEGASTEAWAGPTAKASNLANAWIAQGDRALN
jgi:hypothetical protein